MAITATLNPGYNPKGNINQKYRPLADKNIKINADETDKGTIQDIADYRMQTMAATFRNIYYLRFYGSNISGIAEIENAAGRKPPLAVVSSGRSTWIRSMYDTGKRFLEPGQQHFTGIDDIAPFSDGDTIPLYFPYRFSAGDYGYRSVYIFVEESEYESYTTDLAGTGLIVIGYQVGAQRRTMLGFGASRYAAAKFFSHINIPKVWFIDDNVIYIDKLSEFDLFEQRMAIDKMWALGGSGLPSYLTDDDIKKIQQEPAIDPKGKLISPLFLQQAVLWDIAQLTNSNNLQISFNYSPYFIGSGEDVSITYFLGKNRCKAFRDCFIRKGSPLIDTAITYEQHQAKEVLERGKGEIRQLIEKGPPIPINNNSNLWDLLKSDTKFGSLENCGITYMKAGEQLLLKWMYFENKKWNWEVDDIRLKLLYSLFNFTEDKLVSLDDGQVEYDIELIDATLEQI